MPPGRTQYFDTCACLVTASTPMVATTAALHAHLTGRRIWIDLFRFDAARNATLKVATLASDDEWSFDNQRTYSVPNVTILDGDVIATTCVYDTTSRAAPTRGGPSSSDEARARLLACRRCIAVYT